MNNIVAVRRNMDVTSSVTSHNWYSATYSCQPGSCVRLVQKVWWNDHDSWIMKPNALFLSLLCLWVSYRTYHTIHTYGSTNGKWVKIHSFQTFLCRLLKKPKRPTINYNIKQCIFLIMCIVHIPARLSSSSESVESWKSFLVNDRAAWHFLLAFSALHHAPGAKIPQQQKE